jgi:hypothetical protein
MDNVQNCDSSINYHCHKPVELNIVSLKIMYKVARQKIFASLPRKKNLNEQGM